MFLLDTNVVSELRSRSRADHRVLQWADSSEGTAYFISVVTLFEIEKGMLLLRRKDRRQAANLDRWIREYLLVDFADRILAYDDKVALRCAALHVPDPRAERDAMIGATALEYRLTVVTRNVRDFEPMGVPLLNPWDEA